MDAKKLSGLLVWVDGQNFGDAGTTITDWPDQSGNGFHLTPTGGTAPSIVASAIGGLPAANFVSASGNGLAASSTNLAIGSDNFVIELVVSVSTGGSSGVLAALGLPAGDQAMLFGGDGNVVGRFETGDVTASLVSDGSHVVAFRRLGTTTAELRLDGAATPLTLASTHALGGAFAVGFTGSTLNVNANIAEVVVQQNPTNGDVIQLESYLKTKYGL